MSLTSFFCFCVKIFAGIGLRRGCPHRTISDQLVNGGRVARITSVGKSVKCQFKQLMRAHKRWVTFSGAFIVFMTFVVKEGLEQRWQDEAGALTTAKYMYAVRS